MARPARILDEPVDELDGITKSTCARACSPERCVITHQPRCAHPHKGGMQGNDYTTPEIVERFQDAVKKIKHQAIDSA